MKRKSRFPVYEFEHYEYANYLLNAIHYTNECLKITMKN